MQAYEASNRPNKQPTRNGRREATSPKGRSGSDTCSHRHLVRSSARGSERRIVALFRSGVFEDVSIYFLEAASVAGSRSVSVGPPHVLITTINRWLKRLGSKRRSNEVHLGGALPSAVPRSIR